MLYSLFLSTDSTVRAVSYMKSEEISIEGAVPCSELGDDGGVCLFELG